MQQTQQAQAPLQDKTYDNCIKRIHFSIYYSNKPGAFKYIYINK